jgi:CheY-like chemotaxis protein
VYHIRGLLLATFMTMRCGQIVIIEDDEGIRNTLREMVEIEGYSCQTAENGEEAFALLKRLGDEPCLILTDLSMPVMDGYQFIELASKCHTIATIPIVVVSAAPDTSRLNVHTQSGKVKGLIKKPVDLEYLLRIVHEHCELPKKAAQSEIHR